MKKILSVFLAVVLCVSLVPSAYALNPLKPFWGLYDQHTRWDTLNSIADWIDSLAPDYWHGGGSVRGGGAGRRDYYTQPSSGVPGGPEPTYASPKYGTGDGYTNSGSGAQNDYVYNGGAVTNYSIFQSTTNNYSQNITDYYWYNPVTNNYYQITNETNVYYSPTYNTYHITNNEYNTYITYNVTYVSYYVDNITEESTYYYEIYYSLPDGRNSYNLEPEDIWGEYFFYGVTNYREAVEDDGVTLGLYHFDGNALDSSYYNRPLSGLNGGYASGLFSSCLQHVSTGVAYSGVYRSCTATSSQIDIPPGTVAFECFVKLSRDYWKQVGRDNVGVVVQLSQAVSANCGVNVGNSTSAITVTTGYQHHLYGVISDGKLTWYVDGVFLKTLDIVGDSSKLYLTSGGSSEILYDELRFLSKDIHNGDFTPPTQPFDTNLVLVVPETGDETTIAVKSNVPVGNLRVGGVRPTFPEQGDVYVYLENDVVRDVQQYQNGGWQSVTASIYENGAWTPFNGKDVSNYVQHEPEPDDPDPTPTPDPGGTSTPETPGGGGDDDDGGFWDFLTDLFGGLIDLLASLVGGAVKLLSGVLGGLVDLFKTLLSFVSGFTDFLTAAFAFLPADMLSALSAGIILMVIIAIIKFIGGFL